MPSNTEVPFHKDVPAQEYFDWVDATSTPEELELMRKTRARMGVGPRPKGFGKTVAAVCVAVAVVISALAYDMYFIDGNPTRKADRDFVHVCWKELDKASGDQIYLISGMCRDLTNEFKYKWGQEP